MTFGLQTSVNTLPEGESRDEAELALQLAYGKASMAVHSYAGPETVAALERSQYLAERVGTSEQYDNLITGLFAAHVSTARLSQAAAVASQVLGRARHREDQALAYVGHAMTGCSAFFLGDMRSACEHLRLAIENPKQFGAIIANCDLAWAESVIGHRDKALSLSETAVIRSRAMNHALTLGQAMSYNDFIHLWRKDYQALLLTSRASLEFCEKHNVRYWCSQARLCNVYAKMKLSGSEGVFQEYVDALAPAAHVGALPMPFWHSLAADLLKERGQPEDAIKELEKAFSLIASTGERWYEPETERIHGECLAALGSPAVQDAENCFRRALDKAHSMGALTYKLNAALSFHAFLAQHDRATEGVAILAPIYVRFTEGFNLPDQRAAKAILDAANFSY